MTEEQWGWKKAVWCEVKCLIHMYIFGLYCMEDIYLSQRTFAFLLSFVKLPLPGKIPISWIWISNLFWCVTVKTWVWPVQLIRSYQSTKAHTVHSRCISTYIQLIYSLGMSLCYCPNCELFFILWHLCHMDTDTTPHTYLFHMLYNITDDGKCVHLSYICPTPLCNKPITLYLTITICPFSIMSPEIMIKITVISSPLLHIDREWK